MCSSFQKYIMVMIIIVIIVIVMIMVVMIIEIMDFMSDVFHEWKILIFMRDAEALLFHTG